MIVASPWSRGGWVNSQLFDHTSTVMFLENFVEAKFGKQVKEENLSAWRRAISGDLSSIFRTNHRGENPLDFVQRDRFVESIEKAREKEIPNNYRKLNPTEIQAITQSPLHADAISHQEPGIRPASALPYELYANGEFQAGGSRLVLSLTAANSVHGKRSAGAPFNVYLRNLTGSAASEGGLRAATYAVKAGDTLHEEFPMSLFAGKYHIEVLGPNGFYRSFAGDPSAGHPPVELKYEQHFSSLSGNVEVHLRNDGTKPLHFEIEDLSYKTGTRKTSVPAGARKKVVVDLHRQHRWYDLGVRAEGIAGEVRFAGRVENGYSSFTDPLMGGVV
jgi:phospholipase C